MAIYRYRAESAYRKRRWALIVMYLVIGAVGMLFPFANMPDLDWGGVLFAGGVVFAIGSFVVWRELRKLRAGLADIEFELTPAAIEVRFPEHRYTLPRESIVEFRRTGKAFELRSSESMRSVRISRDIDGFFNLEREVLAWLPTTAARTSSRWSSILALGIGGPAAVLLLMAVSAWFNNWIGALAAWAVVALVVFAELWMWLHPDSVPARSAG